MDYVQKARDNFKKGYNCAQAVFCAFADKMDISEEQAVKIASSFGGGMGGMRETCGAVTGMFMAYGAICGYSDHADFEGKTAQYAKIREFAEKFKNEHETLRCGDLLKNLPTKLEQNPLPRTEEYYKVRPCVMFVETAAKILQEELKKIEN
ncbi:MAG: C_GCAxxG_C_C family protein [Clostridia bacterium]|nr:C_GCAxxG_C_C family protein [Clostridia bacterium]